MTQHEYEMIVDAIATSIWEVSSANGRDVDVEFWDSHMDDCYDAVTRTYHEGIKIDDWRNAALKLVS